MHAVSIDHLHERAETLLSTGQRRIVGITGAPGAGKSTLAQELASGLGARAVVVPMDGFHLANVELLRLGLRHCKGAAQTFDSAGYAALLARLRRQAQEEVIYVPEFRRDLDEAIAGAISVFAATELVITEGNYLLLNHGSWSLLRPLLHEVWYLDLDPEERRRRLVARHMYFGRDEDAARSWVAETDEPNAALIESTRSRADFVFTLLNNRSLSP